MVSWLKPGASLIFACLWLASCGYHEAGKADLVPKTIHTVAIPPFANATVQYKLTDRLAEAISREFIARTHYQVITDPQEADGVVRGTVLNFVAFPILIDPTNGRPSALQVNVTMQVSFVERATGKVIYTRPNFEMHQRYEIAVVNNVTYFEEDAGALNRLSRDVARDLVTSILDNF